MADAGAAGGQRLQPTGCFAFIAQALRRTIQRTGDGIKQPSAGRGARRVNAAIDGLRQQRPVALAEGGGLRIILPVRDKGQALSQQISPRLARRQVTARQRDGRQPAKMFALAIVNPQALPAPQRAVLPHADAVEGQGDNVAAVKRPAVLGQARRSMSMVMQHRLHRQRQGRRPLR